MPNVEPRTRIRFASRQAINMFNNWFPRQVSKGNFAEDDKPDAWVLFVKENVRDGRLQPVAKTWDNPFRQNV